MLVETGGLTSARKWLLPVIDFDSTSAGVVSVEGFASRRVLT